MSPTLRPNELLANAYRFEEPRVLTGIGELWLAVNRTNDQPCALGIFPGVRDREPAFGTQARNLEVVPEVPLMPRVLGHGTVGPFFYLVLERFPAYRSLAACLETWRSAHSTPDLATIVALFDLLCDRLERAHRPPNGRTPWVHGNLSPVSVLLKEKADGTVEDVLLLDLGLGSFLDRKALDKQTARRLDRYQPPEPEGELPTHLHDIFSLGVILLELLTGTTELPNKPPDEKLSIAYKRYEKELVPTIKATYGERSVVLGEALLRAFARHHRYQSVDEMRKAIGSAMTKLNDPKKDDGPHLFHDPPQKADESGPRFSINPVPGEIKRPGEPSIPAPPPAGDSKSRKPPVVVVAPPKKEEASIDPLRGPTLGAPIHHRAWDDPELTVIDDVWHKEHRERFAGVPTGNWVVRHALTGVGAVLKPFAAKRLQPPESGQRIEEEAKVPNRFRGPARHHVRRVLDVVKHPKTVQTPYLVLELVEGVTLDALVKERQRLPVEEALTMLHQLAQVLTEAGELKLVHGELDPTNLLLEADREGLFVKVLNFGATRDEMNTTRSIPIPLTYAPEQLRAGAQKTPATDVWAFGQLAFYLLVGSFYFPAPLSLQDAAAFMAKRLREVPPSARAKECGWELPQAEDFDRWFERHCAVLDPAERSTPAVAFRDLQQILRPSRKPPPIHRSEGPSVITGPRPTRSPCETVKAHGDTVRSIALSPNGVYFATGGGDRRVCIWDLAHRSLIEVLSEHEETVRSVTWCGNAWVVSCAGDRTLRFWEPGFGRHAPRCLVLESQTSFLNTVVGTIDENRQPLIFTGGMDFVVRCRSRAPSGEWSSSAIGKSAMPVRALAIGAGGRRILAASDLQEPTLFELDDTHESVGSRSLLRHNDGVWAVAISPDGKRAVSGSRDRTVKTWLLHDQEFITPATTFKGHEADVSCVAFLSETQVVSGSYDGTVRVWDAKTERCVEVFDGHQGAVWCLAVADQGETILSGGSDGLVRIWKRGTGLPGTQSLFG